MTNLGARITRRLWQGPKPPTGPFVRHAGFDVLVLAAEEYQPAAHLFPGVRVIHAPIDDARLSRSEALRVEAAAREVARALQSGQRVLVTCWMGLNRSGIISARALQLLGVPIDRAIAMVRAARPNALFNKHFVRHLRRSPRRRHRRPVSHQSWQ